MQLQIYICLRRGNCIPECVPFLVWYTIIRLSMLGKHLREEVKIVCLRHSECKFLDLGNFCLFDLGLCSFSSRRRYLISVQVDNKGSLMVVDGLHSSSYRRDNVRATQSAALPSLRCLRGPARVFPPHQNHSNVFPHIYENSCNSTHVGVRRRKQFWHKCCVEFVL